MLLLTWKKIKNQQLATLLWIFLQENAEYREIEKIPQNEFNFYIGHFIVAVWKRDGGEYEPSVLRGMLTRFEQYLKSKEYAISLITS